jgi:transketolase
LTTATEGKIGQEQLDQLCINTIRFLAVDAVQKANSGHPGAPMGLAPTAYSIFMNHLRFNPKNPKWRGRDRFILSNGHASMLLYSMLFLTGYDLPLEQLKQFRQWGSLTPGHPEYGLTPGVETTTGPLGQGFSTGVGMGVAQKFLSATFDPSNQVLDYKIYAICSDGDLEEGVSSEAASIAGHLQLDNLIYLYDDNHISIEGNTDIAFTEDVYKRFEAYGWHVQRVADGNDLNAINAAIETAKQIKGKPHFIGVRTIIGYGSPNRANTGKAHGQPLGKDEVKLTKENLKWPLEPEFYVPDEALAHFRQSVERGAQLEADWNKQWQLYKQAQPELSQKLEMALKKELAPGWDSDVPKWGGDAKAIATRAASGEVLQKLAPKVPTLIGGSADLAESTNTTLEDFGSFEPSQEKGGSWTGRTMHYGVREHGMGAVINGMTLSNLWAYGATFLIFSDYMRAAVRLACLMNIPSIFIFTHDSVGLGEDGPTHQPIEQLMALRMIPNMNLLRPADANETAEAWRYILQNKGGPTVLVLTRQKLPILDQQKYAPASNLAKGGYILSEAQGGKPQVILMATGSEVSLALDAQKKLQEEGIAARVVSMPSLNLFDRQPEEYRKQVLPDDVPARLSIELGVPTGWDKYVGPGGAALGIEHFGASSPYETILEHFGVTVENVTGLAKQVINDPAAARRAIADLQISGAAPHGGTISSAPASGHEGHS